MSHRQNLFLLFVVSFFGLINPQRRTEGSNSEDREVVCATCENTWTTVKNVPEFMKKTIQAMFLTVDSRDPGCEWGLTSMSKCQKPNILVPSLVVSKCFSLRRRTTATGLKQLFPDAIFELNYYRRGCTYQWAGAGDVCYSLEDINKRRNGSRVSRLKNSLMRKWSTVNDTGELCIYSP